MATAAGNMSSCCLSCMCDWLEQVLMAIARIKRRVLRFCKTRVKTILLVLLVVVLAWTQMLMLVLLVLLIMLALLVLTSCRSDGCALMLC